MNEIQLIRDQLTRERQHCGAIANACVEALAHVEASAVTHDSPLWKFRQACVDYLARVLAWFEERDQRLTALAHGSNGGEDLRRGALGEALARPGRSREALERLAGACAHASGWPQFAQFFNGVWSTRRAALDELLAAGARVADWRAVGGIDADSIFEERRLYTRVKEALPPGVALADRA